MPDLVDPRLLASLADAFPQTATIEGRLFGQDQAGDPVDAWTSGQTFLVTEEGAYITTEDGDLIITADGTPDTIACALYGAGGREVKRADQTVAVATHRALLAGYRDDLTPAHRVTIGGQVYNILAVEQDKLRLVTRLMLEVVT